MKIKYYEINDCKYELINEKHTIVAPEGSDEELLKKRGFVQLLDGRWVHYMTFDEEMRLNDEPDAELLIFSESDIIRPENQANSAGSSKPEIDEENQLIFSIAMLFLFILGILISVTTKSGIGLLITGASILSLFISSLKFNKTAFKFFIAVIVLQFIILMFVVSKALDSMFDGCSGSSSSCESEFQGILEMGSLILKAWVIK